MTKWLLLLAFGINTPDLKKIWDTRRLAYLTFSDPNECWTHNIRKQLNNGYWKHLRVNGTPTLYHCLWCLLGPSSVPLTQKVCGSQVGCRAGLHWAQGSCCSCWHIMATALESTTLLDQYLPQQPPPGRWKRMIWAGTAWALFSSHSSYTPDVSGK